MAGSTERAVLAGGCFWGMQDLIRRYPGVVSTRVGYTGGEVPNATYRNHGQSRRGDRDHLRSGANQLPQAARVLLSDPRSHHPKPSGQRCRGELPFGDLHDQRRAEAGRARHHRGRERLRSVARESGHGSRARGSVLAGRARASGLSRALSERLHLPFSPRRTGCCRSGPRPRNKRRISQADGSRRSRVEGLQLPGSPLLPGRLAWSRLAI